MINHSLNLFPSLLRISAKINTSLLGNRHHLRAFKILPNLNYGLIIKTSNSYVLRGFRRLSLENIKMLIQNYEHSFFFQIKY